MDLFLFNLSAQNAATTPKDTSYWKLSGITGINFSQTALVNWVAGGENAVATAFYLNGSLNYAKEKWAWDNDLSLEYGVIYSDEYDWRKNADKISFTSKLGYQINKKFYYSLLADYNTQFAKGYNYPNTNQYLSTFMAPGYSNIALGVDYKPNDQFSIFLSPITTRFLFVVDDSLSNAGAYGIDPGDKVKVETGTLLKATMKKTVMENVDIISKLDVFTPYSKNFGNMDVNWELLASFKINKILTATLNTTLRYYDREHYINSDGKDEGPKLQFKEIFGLGIAYRF
jgi:hypothetical protein